MSASKIRRSDQLDREIGGPVATVLGRFPFSQNVRFNRLKCNDARGSNGNFPEQTDDLRGYSTFFPFKLVGTEITVLTHSSVFMFMFSGKQAYDAYSYLCCEGNVVRKVGSRSACCGREPYDVLFYLCCDGYIIRKPGSSAGCCGKEAYDPRYYTCCPGNRLVHGTRCWETIGKRDNYPGDLIKNSFRHTLLETYIL